MSDFAVHQYGVDSSGRAIWMTVFLHDWIEARVAAVGFRPVIIQGCFMTRDGGGAKDSEGAHNEAGSVDFRTRDLTEAQIDAWVKECREHGGAAFRRDETPKHGGMEPHCHVTVGADHPLAPMAELVWSSYVGGGDGLAAGRGRPGNASDYEWRPSPLVLIPPEEDMALSDDDVTKVAQATAQLVLKHLIPTDDQPKGRYLDSILQKLYNKAFPKK